MLLNVYNHAHSGVDGDEDGEDELAHEYRTVTRLPNGEVLISYYLLAPGRLDPH